MLRGVIALSCSGEGISAVLRTGTKTSPVVHEICDTELCKLAPTTTMNDVVMIVLVVGVINQSPPGLARLN